jgi:hypothetical protein
MQSPATGVGRRFTDRLIIYGNRRFASQSTQIESRRSVAALRLRIDARIARSTELKTLVDARTIHPQSFDFVLHLQLATLKFRDLKVVDRRMLQRLGDLGVERLVPPQQFRKVRLNGHVGHLPCQIGGYKF